MGENSGELQHEEYGSPTFSVRRPGVPNVKRTYRKVELARSHHPHFANGAWYLRHTLDHTSPFLASTIRRRLEQLGGWPASWNSHEEIRKCLNPTIYEIGMIFTGRSNPTGCDVFKAQTWTPEDIYIGWQFVSTSYLATKRRFTKDDGKRNWKVDHSLVHDICPQSHGGNEPLGTRTSGNNIVKFIVQQTQGNACATM